jgi:hypothetical protein
VVCHLQGKPLCVKLAFILYGFHASCKILEWYYAFVLLFSSKTKTVFKHFKNNLLCFYEPIKSI